MKEIYKSEFAPGFIFSTLKENIALVWDYVCKTKKWKVKLAKKYKWNWNMKSFTKFTKFLFRKF